MKWHSRSTALAAAQVSADLPSLRSFVIAALISTLLAGVTAQQLITYFSRSYYDSPLLKLVVVTTSLLSWTDYLFTLITLDTWLIVDEGDYAALNHFGLPFALHAALIGAIAAACQSFYAWRIYILSRRAPFSPVLIILLALASLGSGAATTFHLLQAGTFNKSHATPLIKALHLWSVFAHIWKLREFIDEQVPCRLRSQASEGEEVTRFFKRLVRIAIETNLLTFCLAFAAGVLFITETPRYVYLPLPFIIGRVYEATLLYTVNSRIVMSPATPTTSSGTPMPIMEPVKPVPNKDYIQLVSRMKRQEEKLRDALNRDSEEFGARQYRRPSTTSGEMEASIRVKAFQ
ncbi:uncharacterized protein L969DRAFT_93389 [Mixia osmundae IAM 14324]|uniref:uncharacterized protein n=1 Tax=Mixia osmundae (strain CBS 9802 / IAM 14324 / JCM 22182 / KY 12970) TaxID=764103 RepID=UPI0004A55819|nr:uncharacterized protein L969DRAFT_93389 [Mixia osmundae IAM 14324]KEI40866.1 hypothetical protein L969DRAFT_93389 [Mixia osmundae IAM 14324]